MVALAWAVLAWRRRRRNSAAAAQDRPKVDLTYLEQVIEADEEAAAQRHRQDKPLFSRSLDPPREHGRRPPTEER